MPAIEIISLIISIVALASLCAIFTIFLRNYCKNTIQEIRLGKQDNEIINNEVIRKEKEKSKGFKVKETLKSISSYSLLGILMLILGYSLFMKITDTQMVFGSKSLAVASGSMSFKNEVNLYLENYDNQIQTFDLIWVDKVEDESELKQYDVIAYKDEKNTIIIHRIYNIVEIDGVNYYYTRGDANNLTDTFVSTFDDIVGVYNNKRIPLLGMFILFAKSYVGMATLIGIIYYVYLFDNVTKKIDDETKNRVSQLVEVINNLKDKDSLKSEFIQYIYLDDNIYQFVDGHFVSKVQPETIDNSQNKIYISNETDGSLKGVSEKPKTKRTKSKSLKEE